MWIVLLSAILPWPKRIRSICSAQVQMSPSACIVILSAIFLHLQKAPITEIVNYTSTYTPKLSLYPGGNLWVMLFVVMNPKRRTFAARVRWEAMFHQYMTKSAVCV